MPIKQMSYSMERWEMDHTKFLEQFTNEQIQRKLQKHYIQLGMTILNEKKDDETENLIDIKQNRKQDETPSKHEYVDVNLLEHRVQQISVE